MITQLVDITLTRTAEQARREALEFLSHDMRSPQSSIITLVSRNQASITDPALAQRITGLARKTLTLSDDFVQLARFAVAPFVAEDLELLDLLTEAADELWPFASRRQVQISVAPTEDELFIRGERDVLIRALVNLLENAVKFSPSGGIVHCTADLTADGGVECVIEDEGPGIPEARRANLFARFGHRTAQGESPSAGLGLSFVSAAVRRHGGTITCASRTPSGTRFCLRLPAGAERPD